MESETSNTLPLVLYTLRRFILVDLFLDLFGGPAAAAGGCKTEEVRRRRSSFSAESPPVFTEMDDNDFDKF